MGTVHTVACDTGRYTVSIYVCMCTSCLCLPRGSAGRRAGDHGPVEGAGLLRARGQVHGAAVVLQAERGHRGIGTEGRHGAESGATRHSFNPHAVCTTCASPPLTQKSRSPTLQLWRYTLSGRVEWSYSRCSSASPSSPSLNDTCTWTTRHGTEPSSSSRQLAAMQGVQLRPFILASLARPSFCTYDGLTHCHIPPYLSPCTVVVWPSLTYSDLRPVSG